MRVNIHYGGQLALSAGLSDQEKECADGTTVSDLLRELAEDQPENLGRFLLDEVGGVEKTLFVAVDGEQVLDFGIVLSPDVNEVMILPPIAGG